MNNTKVLPGDAILFRRGDAWRGGQSLYGLSNGAPGAPITFGAYGEGAKPRILASLDVSAASFWAKAGENIWKTTSIINLTAPDFKRRQVTPDVANLIFNDEAAIGFTTACFSRIAATSRSGRAIFHGSAAGRA